MPHCFTDHQIQIAHNRQLDLCARLEEIAERLPAGAAASSQLSSAAMEIGPVMSAAVAARHSLFSSLLQPAADAQADLSPTAQVLVREAEEDFYQGEELGEVLHGLGAGRLQVRMDALAYSLRCFFSSTRRRVALEQEMLRLAHRPVAA
jgi:hypothetical protein